MSLTPDDDGPIPRSLEDTSGDNEEETPNSSPTSQKPSSLEVPTFVSTEFVHPGSPPPSSSLRNFARSSLDVSKLDESQRGGRSPQTIQNFPPQRASSRVDKKLAAAILGLIELKWETLDPLHASSKNQRQRIPEFVYTHDFDTSGIIYYLGTNRFSEKWVNPALLGLVDLTSSEMNADSQPLHCFVGREPVRSLLANVPNSWFTVDFKEHLIVPRHYTLRHYISQDSHAMRYWRLEASVDGETWDILKRHRNDKSLNKKGATHTWELDTYSVLKHKTKAYRIFKIQMTGDNSSDYFHNLCCSGFEIYGFLYDKKDLKADEDGDYLVDIPEPVEGIPRGTSVVHLTPEEISIGESLLKQSDVKFSECRLYENEFFMTTVNDVPMLDTDFSLQEKRLSIGSETRFLSSDPTSVEERAGVRIVEFAPEEISDEKLRENLKREPTKKILKDVGKGWKKNKNHIKFADEVETDDKPELITLVLVDMEMCHHGTTRGRKCPNSASREI